MTVQWALLHLEVRETIAPLRNDPAELGIALHAPFSICRIRQMAKYILPGEDNHFIAMHSAVSLSRVLASDPESLD